MDPIRKIPKKFTKKFGNKVINRQYFCRKTGLKAEGRKTNFQSLEAQEAKLNLKNKITLILTSGTEAIISLSSSKIGTIS